MQTTMDLLSKALEKQPSAYAWCKELGLSKSTLAVAKHRGRLAPSVAGGLAMKLGESPAEWIAIAALEAEPASPLLEQLKAKFKECRFS
jgi:hypothetical protein